MNDLFCPKCKSQEIVKSGMTKGKQRYKCHGCNYNFTVMKEGKSIDPYYVIKTLQLYIEGVTLREIERILGVSHVSVMNWVRKYNIKAPENLDYKPTYKVLNHTELMDFFKDKDALKHSGIIVREKIGTIAVFKNAAIVKRLPKTRSGKILRKTISEIADGKNYIIPSTIDDPSILDEIKAVLTARKIGTKFETDF